MSMTRVPTLDLRRLETDRTAFVRELGEAYRTFGFCCFVNHGIDQVLIDQAYEAFKDFFSQPLDEKMRYHQAGKAGTRGYTPNKVETAKTSSIADLKEFWHIGREVSPGNNPYPDILEPNVWPDSVPQFKPLGLSLYNQMEAVGRDVLRGMAINIGLPEHFFASLTKHGNSILRALHYPPINPEDLPAVRAEAHEDISLITLLVGATDSGLELLTREGKWLPIETERGAIIVNVGDMMQRQTNHVYPSTTHRVINPEGEAAKRSRYSMPFFMDPNPDFLIETIPSCITPDNPDRYEGQPITAHDYLMERLAEIKLTLPEKK